MKCQPAEEAHKDLRYRTMRRRVVWQGKTVGRRTALRRCAIENESSRRDDGHDYSNRAERGEANDAAASRRRLGGARKKAERLDACRSAGNARCAVPEEHAWGLAAKVVKLSVRRAACFFLLGLGLLIAKYPESTFGWRILALVLVFGGAVAIVVTAYLGWRARRAMERSDQRARDA